MKLLKSSKIFSQFSHVSRRMQRSSCNLLGKVLEASVLQHGEQWRCQTCQRTEGTRGIARLVWPPKISLNFTQSLILGKTEQERDVPVLCWTIVVISALWDIWTPVIDIHENCIAQKMCFRAMPAVSLFSCALNSLTIGEDWRLFRSKLNRRHWRIWSPVLAEGYRRSISCSCEETWNKNHPNFLLRWLYSFNGSTMGFLKGTKQQSKGRNNTHKRKRDTRHCCTKIHG